MDIAAWLQRIQLSQYERAFIENAVDFEVLPKLTAEDLRDLGVTLVGHRRKLLAAIDELCQGSVSTAELAEDRGSATDLPPGQLGPAAERRRITVMFYDLVGSTALSTQIDPEELREVIGAYHRRLGDVITRLGGFVARVLGDGALVYFGYPQAHEDDPERSVRAALEAIEAVGQLEPVEGQQLQIRIGIATGVVVVGDIIGNMAVPEHDVVGEIANLAARLQAVAQANSIIIAANTRRLLGRVFECRPLPKLDLKGFARSVQAYEVLAVVATHSRFEALRATTMAPVVGRDEECDLLLRRWNRARDGEGEIVLLSGEAGIGKSRLAAALVDQIRITPHTRLRYFCSPYHSNSVLFPVIGHIGHAAGFEREDTPERKLDKLERIFPHTDPVHLALIAEVMNVPSGDRYPISKMPAQKRKEQVLAALIQNLENLARDKPVLLLVEDVHWIDPTSRELLELIIERVPSWPILLVITFRPEFHPPWIGHPHTTALTLGRLRARDGSALIQQIGGGRPLPKEVLDQIVARSDGVPLFIEEITKAVLESGQLEEHETRYTRQVPPLDVPASLDASLMARLDRLTAAKPIAQIAATIGREFSYELLTAIAGAFGPVLRDALAQLVDSGLVFERGEPPNAVYRFKHALVRDAAYGSLLRRNRRDLHLRIGEAFERQFPEIVRAQPDLLAHHFNEAEAPEKAITYWERAGRQAVAQSAMAEAAAHLRQALEMLQRLPETAERQQRELDLLTGLGGALIAATGYTSRETGQVYQRARQLCEQLSDTTNLIHVANGLWSFYAMRAEIEDALRLSRELLARGREIKSPVLLLTANRLLGAGLFQVGKLTEARGHLEIAQQMLADMKDEDAAAGGAPDWRDAAVGVPAYLSVLLALLGHYDQARAYSLVTIAEAKRSFRPHRFLFAIGVAGYWFGALLREDTTEAVEQLAALSAEHDFPYWAACALQCRGLNHAEAGRAPEGIALVLEGTRRQILAGANWANPFFVGYAAQFAEPDQGLALVDDALGQATTTGVCWFRPELHRIRGELLRRNGSPDLAESHLVQSLGEARSQGALHWELRAAMSLARLWQEQGKPEQGRDLLAPIYARFTEGLNLPDLLQARALLEELRWPPAHLSRLGE